MLEDQHLSASSDQLVMNDSVANVTTSGPTDRHKSIYSTPLSWFHYTTISMTNSCVCTDGVCPVSSVAGVSPGVAAVNSVVNGHLQSERVWLLVGSRQWPVLYKVCWTLNCNCFDYCCVKRLC